MTQTNTAASFDLDDILGGTDKPLTFDVGVLFDDEGNAISGFRIVSRNSDQARAAERAVRIENQKAAAKRNKALDLKTDDGAAKVIDIVDGQNQARAAAIIVDWFGWTKKDADGNQVPRQFDAALVPTILKQKPTWVEKILAAHAEDNNFLPKSPISSATSHGSN